MHTLLQRLVQKRVLISDGGWGTLLMQRGLKLGECPERWNLERPGDVRAVAQGYVDAGADLIGTNTFGATRLMLRQHGIEDQTTALNEAGARLSREAAGDRCLVSGSMGPTGKFLITGEVTEDELYEAFREQAVALERGGADCCTIETMAAIDEACVAVRAAKENTGLTAIATFTYNRMPDGSHRTMMGAAPAEVAEALAAAGASVIGANCGQGPEGMVDIVRELRSAAPDLPILVHPNAGLPVQVDGKDTYIETPEAMAAIVPALLDAGASIVGGCCGTTPDHIRAIRAAVERVLGG